MAGGAERGTGAVVVAMVTSACAAAAKLAAFAVTGSASLLAEGAHSVADAGSQALLLLGGQRAGRDAATLHPLGSSPKRYFWPFIGTVVLLVAGAAVAVSQGIEQLEDPDPLTSPEWAYGALAGSAVLAALSLRTAVVRANRVRGRATWRRFLRGSRSPEVPVVLVQGMSALLGVVVAAAAVAASELTGDPVWDGAGSVAVGVLLGLSALALLGEMRASLIGSSGTQKDVEAVTAAIEIDPAVRDLIHMRTHHLGPDDLLVGAKVELDHELSFPEVAEVVNRIERNVRRAVPVARTIYIEPDVPDWRRAAPAVEHHQPGHDVPPEIRARLQAEARRGALGEHIVVEDDGTTA